MVKRKIRSRQIVCLSMFALLATGSSADDFESYASAAMQWLDKFEYRQVINYSTLALDRWNPSNGIEAKCALLGARGDAYVHTDQLDKALKDYDAIRATDPDDKFSFACDGRATVFKLRKKYKLVLQEATRCLTINPKNPHAYQYRAFAYDHFGNTRLALQDFGRAIKLGHQNKSKDLPDFYFNRGLVYQRRKMYRRALPDISKSLEIKPKGYRYYIRGTIYEKLGDEKMAEQDFKRGRELDPNLDETILKAKQRGNTDIERE